MFQKLLEFCLCSLIKMAGIQPPDGANETPGGSGSGDTTPVIPPPEVDASLHGLYQRMTPAERNAFLGQIQRLSSAAAAAPAAGDASDLSRRLVTGLIDVTKDEREKKEEKEKKKRWAMDLDETATEEESAAALATTSQHAILELVTDHHYSRLNDGDFPSLYYWTSEYLLAANERGSAEEKEMAAEKKELPLGRDKEFLGSNFSHFLLALRRYRLASTSARVETMAEDPDKARKHDSSLSKYSELLRTLFEDADGDAIMQRTVILYHCQIWETMFGKYVNKGKLNITTRHEAIWADCKLKAINEVNNKLAAALTTRSHDPPVATMLPSKKGAPQQQRQPQQQDTRVAPRWAPRDGGLVTQDSQFGRASSPRVDRDNSFRAAGASLCFGCGVPGHQADACKDSKLVPSKDPKQKGLTFVSLLLLFLRGLFLPSSFLPRYAVLLLHPSFHFFLLFFSSVDDSMQQGI